MQSISAAVAAKAHCFLLLTKDSVARVIFHMLSTRRLDAADGFRAQTSIAPPAHETSQFLRHAMTNLSPFFGRRVSFFKKPSRAELTWNMEWHISRLKNLPTSEKEETAHGGALVGKRWFREHLSIAPCAAAESVNIFQYNIQAPQTRKNGRNLIQQHCFP